MFNPNLTNYNDERFLKARELAKKVIEMDGKNFAKTYERLNDLIKSADMPEVEIRKVGLNDFYRLETKLAFVLYLQSRGMSFKEFLLTSSED